MKKFLVTGGAGFIGSHITETLVSRGHFVRVLDDFSSGKEENLRPFRKKIEVVKADIRSPQACLKAAQGMDYVLHQAALRSVPKSLQRPAEYNEVNIQGTLNLLNASLQSKVKMFVFASSSSVYGDAKVFPEREGFLPSPISPYALTKLAGEYYCRMFSMHFGLPTASLRYFNVFGPRQSLDDEYAVVVPKFIACFLKNERPPVFGNGRQSRDFTFVSNVVDANLRAAARVGLRGETFNVAGGRDYTVLELVKALAKISGRQLKPVFLPKRPGDVFRTLADLSLARKKIGFQPKVGFPAGLKITYDYFKEKMHA